MNIHQLISEAKIDHLACQNAFSRHVKTKTLLLYFEKQGPLCSSDGNLSVKVDKIFRILISYHNPTLKVNCRQESIDYILSNLQNRTLC